MRIVIGLLIVLMLFGCVSGPSDTSGQNAQENVTNGTTAQVNTTPPETTTENTTVQSPPGIVDVKNTDQIIQDKKDGPEATSQSDCSTLSPNCGTCVAQPNCGWCKSRNGCFYGDESGPAPGIADCPEADWAYSDAECQGSKGGITCEDNWNCADCLTGSGCKWCIDGSKCASVDTTDSCSTGGWMTESFQCNYASR